MKLYQNHKKEMSSRCIKSLVNHSWYLHETLVPMNLCDPKFCGEEKKEIADKLLKVNEGEYTLQYMIEGPRPSFADFIKPGSRLIFDMLETDDEKLEWLLLPSATWSLMSQYRKFADFVKDIPVVNDAAEIREILNLPRISYHPVIMKNCIKIYPYL